MIDPPEEATCEQCGKDTGDYFYYRKRFWCRSCYAAELNTTEDVIPTDEDIWEPWP